MVDDVAPDHSESADEGMRVIVRQREPVTCLARSDARNTIAAATSSGAPMCPTGSLRTSVAKCLMATSRSRPYSAARLSANPPSLSHWAVRVGPGGAMLLRMPLAPNSFTHDLARLTTLYITRPVNPPLFADTWRDEEVPKSLGSSRSATDRLELQPRTRERADSA